MRRLAALLASLLFARCSVHSIPTADGGGATLVPGESVVATDRPGAEGMVDYVARGVYDWQKLDWRGDITSTPPVGVRTMVFGPDEHLWYLTRRDNDGRYHSGLGILRLDGTHEILGPIYTQAAVSNDIYSVAVGADGDSIWYTCHDDRRIGRLSSVRSGTRTHQEWQYTGEYAGLGDIVAGPDGAMWFTAEFTTNASGALGRITDAGDITMFPVPDLGSVLSRPKAIASDGTNLWFNDGISIARMDVRGNVTRFAAIDPKWFPPGTDYLYGDVIFHGDSIWFTTNTSSTNRAGIGRIFLNQNKIRYYTNFYDDNSVDFRRWTTYPLAAGALAFDDRGILWMTNGGRIDAIDLPASEARGVVATETDADGRTLEFCMLRFSTPDKPSDVVSHTAPSRITGGAKDRYPRAQGLVIAPSGETMDAWFVEAGADRIARFPFEPYDGPIGFVLTAERPVWVPDSDTGGPFNDVWLGTLTDTKVRPSSYYTVNVRWGDGATSVATLVPRTAGGFEVRASHTYDWTGCSPVSNDRCAKTVDWDATAKDGRRAAAGSISLSGPRRVRLVSEYLDDVDGEGFTDVAVAKFTDYTGGGAAAYTASIDWLDGTTSAGTIVSRGGRDYSILGSHRFSAYFGGIFAYSPFYVRLAHKDGSGVDQVMSFVRPPVLTASGKFLSSSSVTVNTTFATFTDAMRNPRGPYQVSYECEADDDGLGCVAGDLTTGAGFSIQGDIRFYPPAETNFRTVTMHITIKAADGRVATADTAVTITLVGPPPKDPPPDPLPPF